MSFEDKITSTMRREAKDYGKIGNVDKIQILSIEELVDQNKMFELPEMVLTL